MDGVSRLVAHCDEVVAFFDEVLAPTPPRQKPAREVRVDETLAAPCAEHFDGVEAVYVEWLGWPDRSKMRQLRIAFDGRRPKEWTPARAALESRWASRDAVANAIAMVTREGATDRAFAGRVAGIYGGWLERREELIDGQRLRRLVADAIEAARGNLLACQAVEALRNELRRLFAPGFIDANGLPGFADFRAAAEWGNLRRVYLLPALNNARDYGDSLSVHRNGEAAGGKEGTSETGTWEDRGAQSEWLAKAMLMVRDHPEMSDSEIARRVGKDKSTLSRSEEFQMAAGIARESKKSVPRGRVDSSGRIEAEDPAIPFPVVGERVPGSNRRLRWEKCDGCGDSIRVAAGKVGTRPRCDRCED